MPRCIKHTAPTRPFAINLPRAIELFDAKPYQERIVSEALSANVVRQLAQERVLQIAARHLVYLQSAFVNTAYSTLKRRQRFTACDEICKHITSGGDFKSLPDRILSAIQEIDSEGVSNDSRN